MRGAVIILASALGAAALVPAPVLAAAPRDGIDAVLGEKVAAVTIVRSKARKYTAAIAHGRLLQAYLAAATRNEGERLKERLLAALKTLQHRNGLEGFRILWPSGEVLAELKPPGKPARTTRPSKDIALREGLSQDSNAIDTLLDGDTLNHVASAERDGRKQLIVASLQDSSAYQRALAFGLDARLYIMVVDERDRIVSDSDGSAAPGKPARIAGLTIRQVRERLSVTGPEGRGVIMNEGQPSRIGLRSAVGWTVVAMERPASATPCLRNTDAPCR